MRYKVLIRIYKMPNLLQYTTLLYLFPFLESLKQPDKVFTIGLALTICTSLAHHHKIPHKRTSQAIRVLDMLIVHAMIAYHVFKAVYLAIYTWRVYVMFAAIIYSGVIYWLLGLSNEYWHSTIHVTTALGSWLLMRELTIRSQK